MEPPMRDRAPIRHFDRARRIGERQITRIAEKRLNPR